MDNRKRAYLARHVGGFSDASLADALAESKQAVRDARKRWGLSRSKDEAAALKREGDTPAPRFLWSAGIVGDITCLARADIFLAAGAAFVALVVYLLTLAPSVTGEDSGELIAAAYTMGIAHPPGYPIWCLLGHAFTYIPIGSIGWRVNFMSAFFAAWTVGLVVLITRKLGAGRVASLGAALCFAFTRELWEQSVIAEVYTLNAFFIAACLLIVLVWYERRQHWQLFLLAATFGFGICNHNTVAMLGPLFAVFILWMEPHWRRYGVYAACIVVALGVAALVHLYLPIRAATNPPVNWGNPSDWDGFKDVVTRAQYSFMYTDDPRTIGRFMRHLLMVGGFYAREFTPWVGWIVVFGPALLWKRGSHRFMLVALLTLALSVGYILILNSKFERESMWVATVFYIPFYMMAAIALGLGIEWIATRVPMKWTAHGLAALCIVSPLAMHWHHNDRSGDAWAHDYVSNIFETLEADAIYFPTSDHATFPAIYLQSVEGMRPDITIANKYGYPEESLYADMPVQLRSQFGKIPGDSAERVIEDWVIRNNPTRPVYFTTKRSFPNMPDHSLAQTGLLYRVVRPGETRDERDYFADHTWHTLNPTETREDYTATLIVSDVQYARARQYFTDGDTKQALNALADAVEAAGGNKETLNNFGSLCAENGEYDSAKLYLERAASIDAEYLTPLYNLAKMHLSQGDRDAAIEVLDRILDTRPMDYQAVWLKVEALMGTPRTIEAIDLLERVTRVAPDDARAWRELGFLYRSVYRDETRARDAFARSLAADPNQNDLHRIMLGQEPGETPQVPSPAMPEIPTAPSPAMPEVPGPQIP